MGTEKQLSGSKIAVSVAIRNASSEHHQPRFAEPVRQLEAPPKEGCPAALKNTGGFAKSQVAASDGSQLFGNEAQPSHVGAEPPRKHLRIQSRKFGTVFGSSSASSLQAPEKAVHTSAAAPPPSSEPAVVQSEVLPAPPPAAKETLGDSDSDYAGCFDDAEVVVSENAAMPTSVAAFEVPTPALTETSATLATGEGQPVIPADDAAQLVVLEQSSPGSDLSDVDDLDFEEPQTNDVLFAELSKPIHRTSRRWLLELRNGLVQVNGMECLFSSAKGELFVEANI